jgi:hypothetical protein
MLRAEQNDRVNFAVEFSKSASRSAPVLVNPVTCDPESEQYKGVRVLWRVIKYSLLRMIFVSRWMKRFFLDGSRREVWMNR